MSAIEGHTPTGAHTELPAPWCKDALFVVTTFGDGEAAILVRGWDALCREFVAVHFFDPDPDQAQECIDRLTDWEEWANDASGTPYHLSIGYEDGGVSVTRITSGDSAPTDVADAIDDYIAGETRRA